MFSKRALLAGLGAAAFAATPALAQTAGAQPTLQREGVPHRQARTVNLFRTRHGWPNGMALAPEGLWIGEQQTTGENAAGVSNDAFLYDWNGRVLRTFPTRSKNTSGLGFGGGYLWVGANAPPHGIFQMTPDGETVSHRQIPLGGGGCHGVEYYAGKLYIVSTRLRAVMRVDPDTWEPEFIFPIQAPRYHATAAEGASIWIVAGTGGGAANVGGLERYDLATGRLVETVDFVGGSADPHGLLLNQSRLYSCDAGILPGAPLRASRGSGEVFRIDFFIALGVPRRGYAGRKRGMKINQDKCVACGNCTYVCPMEAIYIDPETKRASINADECVECYACYNGLSQERLPPRIVRVTRAAMRFLLMRFEPDPDICPTAAFEPDELSWPRIVRRAFSDPRVPHESTGIVGRGTEEVKTNDVSNRIGPGEVGFTIEFGRPGVGARFHEIQEMSRALAKIGVSFEKNNPVTGLMKDTATGDLNEDVLNEKVLSAILEIKTKVDCTEDVIRTVWEVEKRIDTVITMGVGARCDENGEENVVAPVLRKLGYKLHRAKTNLGFAAPAPAAASAEQQAREPESAR